ncbi:MAG: hypothetical protein JXQ87_16760 [Bacteroidia bacterium]
MKIVSFLILLTACSVGPVDLNLEEKDKLIFTDIYLKYDKDSLVKIDIECWEGSIIDSVEDIPRAISGFYFFEPNTLELIKNAWLEINQKTLILKNPDYNLKLPLLISEEDFIGVELSSGKKLRMELPRIAMTVNKIDTVYKDGKVFDIKARINNYSADTLYLTFHGRILSHSPKSYSQIINNLNIQIPPGKMELSKRNYFISSTAEDLIKTTDEALNYLVEFNSLAITNKTNVYFNDALKQKRDDATNPFWIPENSLISNEGIVTSIRPYVIIF